MVKKLLLLLLTSSCLAKTDKIIPPLPQHYEYVFQGQTCNGAPIVLKASPEFRCVGPDKNNLHCTGMGILVHNKIDDCIQIHVVRDDPKKVREEAK